jgi:ubiquinone/menaquinone biosynthesis C-methylase UbiE
VTHSDRPIRHRWSAAFYDRMARTNDKHIGAVRDTVAGGAKGRVLEIGCGTGLNLERYDWSQVESLEATEPDIHMLQRAQARAAALPPEVQSRVRLQEARAEALPFADGSFDTVVDTLVLCTVYDQRQALTEVMRVLRPGGELRLAEHVRGEGFTATVQRVIQPAYGWMAAGCQLTRETEAAVRESGFELQTTPESFGALWPGFVGVATKPG